VDTNIVLEGSSNTALNSEAFSNRRRFLAECAGVLAMSLFTGGCRTVRSQMDIDRSELPEEKSGVFNVRRHLSANSSFTTTDRSLKVDFKQIEHDRHRGEALYYVRSEFKFRANKAGRYLISIESTKTAGLMPPTPTWKVLMDPYKCWDVKGDLSAKGVKNWTLPDRVVDNNGKSLEIINQDRFYLKIIRITEREAVTTRVLYDREQGAWRLRAESLTVEKRKLGDVEIEVKKGGVFRQKPDHT
jgi:hypothetical protein